MGLKIKDGQKFLFTGDSITDCGRRGENYPLGNGYVKTFADKVTARFPELKVEHINKGIGGNTIKDLQNRWHDDAVALQPDWLSILVGINDLYRVLQGGPEAVSPEQYRKIYDVLLSAIVPSLTGGVILMEPFYISCDDTGIGMRSRVLEMLPEYIDVVHEMHRKYDTLLIRTHEIFQRQLSFRHPDIFCPEPVHPNQAGHTVIAEALFDALSC
ncbi:MAG: SGNH/GDSL hydrolase family protein [bacterium]|jgi:lysophospholipase L1-like esterase|nr:SGNH/GDSL hydrolase family protein [bacterium]MDD4558377.1 SGNH/GDSL hydrolase family protein [bacterium]